MKFKAIFFLSFLFFFSLFLAGNSPVKVAPKERAVVKTNDRYLFINEKTPDYILKKAVSNGINPAFLIKSKSGAWLRDRLDIIKRTSPIIFVEGKLTDLEKKYFDELVKYTDYRAIIICFSLACFDNESWKHPLIKRKYTISREKNGNIIMKGLKMKSTATKNSVLDDKSFLDEPVVKSGLYFNNISFAFISLDSNVDSSFFKNASKVVYYSGSEKKMSDFVEKKF